jgi:colicin import membrane protein
MTPRMLGNGDRGNFSNFHGMILLSLILHLIVVTVTLLSIRTASRHLTFGAAYSVQLVGSEATLPSSGSSLLKDMLQSKETADSIIIKRKISSIYSTPMKNREIQKLNIEKAVSAIRQKENVRLKTETAAAGRSTMSDTEIGAQTSEYIGAVWSRVKQNWTMPQTLMPDKNILTIINVRISRSGALEYADFEKRSGNRYFDDSAFRAVKKSSPFPPLPYWVRDKSIEIGIRFHSAELR